MAQNDTKRNNDLEIAVSDSKGLRTRNDSDGDETNVPEAGGETSENMAIPYDKCAKVAEHLDSKYHNWKMLASKLDFDEAIELVEHRANIERDSPTIIMLKQWMHEHKNVAATILNEQLKQALLALKRNDIVDEMDEMDDLDLRSDSGELNFGGEIECNKALDVSSSTELSNAPLEKAEPTIFSKMSSNLENVEKGEELPVTSENISCSATDSLGLWWGDRCTFYRLDLKGTSGMFRERGLSVMYGASQGVGIEEVLIGLSENSADLPELRAGQRRLTPVLICMPHNAILSSSLSINLLIPPHTGAITVLYSPASDTQHQQQQAGGEWRPVHDVCCFIHERSISLVLMHFCKYCIMEETLQPSPQTQPKPQPQALLYYQMVSPFLRMYRTVMDTLTLQPSPQPQPRHRIVSVFLRGKQFKKKACVEVTVQFSASSDAAPVAALRGKLVKQQPFSLVNTRPITITMQPADGWTVQNRKEQALFDVDLMECTNRTFHLFGDSATQEMVKFEVQISQCWGHEINLDVCEIYEELVGGGPCGSRPVQEDVGSQSNPSNPFDDENNGPMTTQSPNGSLRAPLATQNGPVTASSPHDPARRSQRYSQSPKKSVNRQYVTNNHNLPEASGKGYGTSLVAAPSPFPSVAQGDVRVPQQAAGVLALDEEAVTDYHGAMKSCEPLQDQDAGFAEIECSDSAPSHSATPEGCPSSAGSTESGFDESTSAAQGEVSDSTELGRATDSGSDEANVPEAGGETSENVALERVTSAALDRATRALDSMPTRHGQIQINVNYHVHHREAISESRFSSKRPWAIPYDKCAKVAEHLDLCNHDWKMLASKLRFDAAIDPVQHQANIERISPTIILLRQWTQEHSEMGTTALYERLKQVLLAMGKRIIVDEMDDLDIVDE